MDNLISKEDALVSLPPGSLLLCNNPEKRKIKFNELADIVSKPASALERLKAFLPNMAAANADMDTKLLNDPDCYNAEQVDDIDGQIIQMNVALVPMEFESGIDCTSELNIPDDSESTSDDSSSDSSSSSSDDDEHVSDDGEILNKILECPADASNTVTTKLKSTNGRRHKRGQPLIETVESIESKAVDSLLDSNTDEQSQTDNIQVQRD